MGQLLRHHQGRASIAVRPWPRAQTPTKSGRTCKSATGQLRRELEHLEKNDIGGINYRMEQLRLGKRRLELKGRTALSHPQDHAALDQQRVNLDAEYASILRSGRRNSTTPSARDSVVMRPAERRRGRDPVVEDRSRLPPNEMGLFAKLGFYFAKLWEFVSEHAARSQHRGRHLPGDLRHRDDGDAHVGHRHAVRRARRALPARVRTQGPATRIIRIAVNNLAGVPSIVFGVFGLGFFVYFVGGSIDRLFYPEALPPRPSAPAASCGPR